MAKLGTVTRGDTEVIELTIRNADGTLRDITTDSIRFTAKKGKYDAVPLFQKTVGSGVPGTAVPSGSIVKLAQSGVTLGRADANLATSDLQSLAREQTLYCDVEVTDSAGKVATTVHTLNLEIDIST